MKSLQIAGIVFMFIALCIRSDESDFANAILSAEFNLALLPGGNLCIEA